jgi:hypothetical protein
MTKEQWDTFKEKLSGQYGSVEMVIDSYNVLFSIRCKKISGMTYTYAILPFLKNEETKGEYMFLGKWLDGDSELKRKFVRVETKTLQTKKDIAFWNKQASHYKKMKDVKGYDRCKKAAEAKYVTCSPYWPSATALKNHLIKNCTSIELI